MSASIGLGSQQDRDTKKLERDFDKRVKAESRKLVNEHAASAAYWESEYQSGQDIISQQNQKIRQLEIDRNTMNKKNAELQESLQGQESLVLDAQSKALQMLDKAEWTPQEDAKTRQELNGLEKLIRNWCKVYAIESFPDWQLETLSEQHLGVLRREWACFSLLPEKDIPIPQGFEDKSMDSKAWVLLTSWLTDFVYSEIFETPFFFLEEFMRQVKYESGTQRKTSARADCDMNDLLKKLEACKSVEPFPGMPLLLVQVMAKIPRTSNISVHSFFGSLTHHFRSGYRILSTTCNRSRQSPRIVLPAMQWSSSSIAVTRS
jgi:hypothetical protein